MEVVVFDTNEKVPLSFFELDSGNWRNNDHYSILGLSYLRYRATQDDIKRMYRQRILSFHPDKNGDKDSFFKCIQKAYEILSDNTKRKQYDSIDPVFNNEIPSENSVKLDFFGVLGPVFYNNSRFSKKNNPVLLGDEKSERQDVENFYDFWYNFESWRSFEFLDEEDTEELDRANKRFVDKKNKNKREKRKKADNLRILKLVDLALKFDPRIKLFKKQDKLAKDAKKAAKNKK